MLVWIWLQKQECLGSGYLVITENKHVYKTPRQHFLANREGEKMVKITFSTFSAQIVSQPDNETQTT